jgi:predicted ATPase
MFTSLTIKNFKAWKETGEIRLAPLTIFFGTNSSGKSSLNQFLLMLKQTTQSQDRQRVLHPGDGFTPVDLGTYQDLVFKHDSSNNLSFSLGWETSEKFPIMKDDQKKELEPDQIRFSSELTMSSNGDRVQVGILQVNSMSYTLSNSIGPIMEIGLQRINGKGGYEITPRQSLARKNPGRGWPIPKPIRFYGFPDEVVSYFNSADFVQDLNLALEKQFQNLFYLGPLREKPRRQYTWSGERPEHIGFNGERAIEALLAAQERRLNLKSKEHTKHFEKLIAEQLKKIGLIDEFKCERITENKRNYEVLIQVTPGSQWVNLTDVGFGISQIFPIVVQGFYLPPNSTLILEQPEIHLHPEIQANMADLFINMIHARENSRNRGIQLLVESHSEHFLRRLQRRVAEGLIDQNEVAIYFCRPGPDGSHREELHVDKFGNICNWPEHFFGDDMSDYAAMSDAAIKRKKNESGQ